MRRDIEIGGKVRPFSLGINSTEMICTKFDIKLKDFDKELAARMKKNEMAFIRYVIYACFYSAAVAKMQEIDFNEMTVGEWCDDLMKGDGLTSLFTGNVVAPTKEKGQKEKEKVVELELP